ncbi:hypothetical protein FRC06_001286 [Ceratobasidium sp. 370]|nr:hypothetical protein FRC06_001286 [Ceratobasidium sp. 370]
MEVHTGSLTLLRRPPLRRSMDLPHFLQDGEGRMSESDEDQSRPRTPVAYDNTDIGLDETSPRPVAQAHRYPNPEEREAFLLEAWQYSAQLTEIDDNETYSQKFLDTVFARMAANRGSSLSKMVSVMEDNFQVSALNKWALFRLMDKDQFLFPSLDRHPTEYFCVGALGSALISILFKASKAIGVVFMEELCKPDNPEKCARWHAKLHDQTARKGVPPSLLAFAAAQMYWALEKLYMGSVVNFDEQHYRAIWDRYFGALLKLPHLGRLRVDMLDLIKEYYMTHWPADEPDEDEVSFPAW